MSKRVIYITEDMLKSPMWLDEKFSRAQAWLDLISLANVRVSQKTYNYKPKTFRRGCLYRSNTNLAARWHWSTSKVGIFLKELQESQRIMVNGKGIDREIEILNYDGLQGFVSDGLEVSVEEAYINSDAISSEDDLDEDEDSSWFDEL